MLLQVSAPTHRNVHSSPVHVASWHPFFPPQSKEHLPEVHFAPWQPVPSQ